MAPNTRQKLRHSLPRSHSFASWIPFALIALIVSASLAACGDDDKKTPTPVATVVPTHPASPTIQASSAFNVGSLADRIGAAWASIKTYRAITSTTSSSATPPTGGSPQAGQIGTNQIVDEVVLPDRKHRTTSANGTVRSELILAGGKIYARGPDAAGLDSKRSNPETWTLIDPSQFDPASPAEQTYAGLVAPIAAPYAALSPEERDRDATPVGSITIGDRTCDAFRIADTTQTGERIEIILALGPDELPCSIETKVGGSSTKTTFTYNVPITVDAPINATPVAS